MQTTSTFTVAEFTPQPFESAVTTGLDNGFVLMRKEFSGGIEGWAQTRFVHSFDMATNTGTYVAIEAFTGTIDGRSGTLNIAHTATTVNGTERTHQLVVIVPGSGTAELAGITGTGAIDIDDGGTHHLNLDYELG